jgi:uncharacterized protein YcfJ
MSVVGGLQVSAAFRIRNPIRNLKEVAMKNILQGAFAIAGLALAAHASAQITFYENDGFRGRSLYSATPVGNFDRRNFNDTASSAIVRGGNWEICEDAGFRGRCVVLRPGQYPALSAMGMNDRVSSARPVDANARIDDGRYAPPPPVAVDYSQRPRERLFVANVTSAHAVMGPPQQRCWVEQEQVQDRGPNVGGALAGAVIGGILGHQIGRGHGNDAATVGGAVVGGAVGANVDRGEVRTQDVQRCNTVPSGGPPAFWDVTYFFGGQEHHVQMNARPGPTIWVNGQGEPRA